VSACHAEGREFESRLSRHLIFFKKGLTIAKYSAILLIMDEITKELQKIKDQISISNGYTDDVRKELSDLNKTLMLIAQILRNK
jgi:hypothetical protein